jgi:hypothetical protein
MSYTQQAAGGMERLFYTFKDSGTATQYDPTDPESYEQFIQSLINDTRDYENSVLAKYRDEAQKYYYGMLPSIDGNLPSEETSSILTDPTLTFGDILGGDYNSKTQNKSTFVSTDVRDAVLSMLPSLIRIFAASEKVVYITPRTQQEIPIAEQSTNYVNYTFWQDNPGFLILYGAFKDAMTVKTGFVKWWTDDNVQTAYKTFANVNQMQIQLLLQDSPGARVVKASPVDQQTGLFPEVVIEYTVSKPIIKVAGVPPEEMRLDRYARSLSRSRIIGHERIVYIDELVAMGYDRDLCANYIQTQDIHNFTMEAQLRNEGRGMSTRIGDGVMYGEWYVWIDREGTGATQLRYICTMGEDHEIVNDESANRAKFACFSVDPISHTIVGDSIADLTLDMQRIKTNMFRGILDSLAESINPKLAVNELMTNLDDAMNDDLGAIIRTRGDPNTAIAYTSTPFVGQAALPVIQLLNEVLQRRTGLSDAAKGLDPKALQSSTMIGVDAVISGAQERIELVARVLAETGFKDLFQGLFNEICENPNPPRILQVNGSFQQFDPSTFDSTMNVEVNPTLGKGTDITRMMALTQIKQDQQTLVSQMGLNNPICGIPEMLNTVTDMLEMLNIKNVGRYFKTPDPQTLQAMQSAPKEPDPMTVASKAQYEKVKADASAKIGQHNLEADKIQQTGLIQRAQLEQKSDYDNQKLALEREKIALEHAQAMQQMQVEREKIQMEANRPVGGE